VNRRTAALLSSTLIFFSDRAQRVRAVPHVSPGYGHHRVLSCVTTAVRIHEFNGPGISDHLEEATEYISNQGNFGSEFEFGPNMILDALTTSIPENRVNHSA
jgi:hypothetical protein